MSVRLKNHVKSGNFVSGSNWDKYTEVEYDGVTYSKGDLAVWKDPDVGMHVDECELIHESVYVARITAIWAIERSYTDSDEKSIQVSIDASGIGRLDIEDIGIVTEDHFSSENARMWVDRFMNSDYSRWMNTKFHLGKEGVGGDVWKHYEDENCDYCHGENGGTEVRGE